MSSWISSPVSKVALAPVTDTQLEISDPSKWTKKSRKLFFGEEYFNSLFSICCNVAASTTALSHTHNLNWDLRNPFLFLSFFQVVAGGFVSSLLGQISSDENTFDEQTNKKILTTSALKCFPVSKLNIFMQVLIFF